MMGGAVHGKRGAGNGKAMRIKRDDVIDAFHDHGGQTRGDLERLFKLKAGSTSIQTHITAMRDEALLYIAEWRPPEKTGMWSPVYDMRTSANEADAPHPPPRNRWRKVTEAMEDPGLPVIVRGKGIKKEHVLMARARSVVQVQPGAAPLGLWGALLAR